MLPRILLLVLLWSAVLSAQGEGAAGLLRGFPGEAEVPPSLEMLFTEFGELLRRADRTSLASLEARMAHTSQEIRLLENLQSALDRGLPVEIPQVLRESDQPEVSPEDLAREGEALEALRSEYRLAVKRQAHGEVARRSPDNGRSSGSSLLAQALLGVQVEVPPPPAATVGALPAGPAPDQEGVGKALYLAGDYRGALEAFASLPPEGRTSEVRCLQGRALERLGKWEEARVVYQEVAAADPEGHWGDLARWMLRFGEHLHKVRELLEAEAPASNGGRP